MANVLQHPIEFQPRLVSHAPSPFGFGFGLGASSSAVATGWQPTATPGHTNPSAFQQLVSSVNHHHTNARPQKRRIELEDDIETSRQSGGREDTSMDRSPTPERPKRAAPKRARVTPHDSSFKCHSSEPKENRASDASDDHDVDIGVLLASLPPQSLLPILNSLLQSQPSLKSVILPLIPRPTLETALQALSQSAKKLRDAYPYSSGPTFTLSSPATTSSGLASKSQSVGEPAFGHSINSNNNGGMRDSYITSRLRPHIAEFVAACFSYLPYFSLLPASETTSHIIGLRSLHKDKSHPSETFLFLSAVMSHVMAQPALSQSQLFEHLLPRLSEEWKAWVLKVDEVVNRQGGMFGSETVRGWERVLDEMADGTGSGVMTGVRDLWVSKVGWLIGRTVSQRMDE